MFCGFVVFKVGVNCLYEEIEWELVKFVCEKIGLVVVFKIVIIVDCLLKIWLGKIFCGIMC